MVNFEWDEKKNHANKRKHGLWFEEAAQVFDDASALMFSDPEHATEEDRFFLLGSSGLPERILIVVFCERGKNGQVIRIISARKATTRERARYEEGI